MVETTTPFSNLFTFKWTATKPSYDYAYDIILFASVVEYQTGKYRLRNISNFSNVGYTYNYTSYQGIIVAKDPLNHSIEDIVNYILKETPLEGVSNSTVFRPNQLVNFKITDFSTALYYRAFAILQKPDSEDPPTIAISDMYTATMGQPLQTRFSYEE